MKIFSLLFFLIIALLSLPATAQMKWYKGSTHMHTTNSDGDSSPEVVTQWYLDHGYNFIVITDHNYRTDVEVLNRRFGKKDYFIVIPGDEVSDGFENKPIHLNALNPSKNVLPQKGDGIVSTLQNDIDAIRAAGAVPHINHPNFRWAFAADELKQVTNCTLLEIYSGHPWVNNLGGVGYPGVEAMWDDVLSSGNVMYGMAVDDMHVIKEPWNRKAARPGQGWVVVRTTELSPVSIMNALDRGEFYSSTGAELEDIQATKESVIISIKTRGDSKYRTQFIGKNGHVFNETGDNPAVYQFAGNEMYIRAKIVDSHGFIAWTQPVMVKK